MGADKEHYSRCATTGTVAAPGSVLTIPWGTTRRWDFFFLNVGIKHFVCFGSLCAAER